jgi:spermidine synthase
MALFLATVSGGAALAHQLLWTRRMVDLLGATPTATTRVLGCFFLGLATGAALATPVARRTRRPWRALAAAEAGVALASVPLLTLPIWSSRVWPAIGIERLAGWPGSAFQLLASGILLLPPSILMGMTLPILVRGALTAGRTLGREGNWLYAFNTAGGALGLLCIAALSLGGAGSSHALGAVMLLGVGIAAVALGMDRRAQPLMPQDDEPLPQVSRNLLPPLLLASLSGLCVLAAEVLAVQLFDQVVSLALLGAAAVLMAVIVPLALASMLGAWIASRLGARPGTLLPALVLALAVCAAAALATPPIFVWQTDGLRYLQLERSPDVLRFLYRAAGLGLLSFGPFMFAAGLVLPLTFAWYQVAAKDPHGSRWGMVLAANGLGGLLGAELTNRLLMPALGMHRGFGVIASAYGLAALLTASRVAPRRARRWWMAGVATTAFALGAAALPTLGALPLIRLDTWPLAARGYALVDLATGPDGVVAVVDFGSNRVILVNNQYVLGGTRSLLRQQRMALLPAVLHPGPRRTAFVGLGTGITAAGALDDPAVESVTAIEISPLVAEMSQRHFGAETQGLATNPRARVLVQDGRIALAAAPDTYDLVVGDLLIPWELGASRLLSVENFRAARSALAQGGVFCQWLPMFQLTPEQFHVIVASFLDAFPRAHVFRDDLSEDGPAFALVGFRDGDLDWTTVERRTRALRESGRTRDGFVAFPRLLRSLYLGVVEGPLPAAAQRNTLENGWLELHASQDQLGSAARYLDAGTWQLLPRYLGGLLRGQPPRP